MPVSLTGSGVASEPRSSSQYSRRFKVFGTSSVDNCEKNSRLAIMQPYLFPYIGYFQLLYSTDRFISYDDVTFIKQGWINRNRILLNGKDHIFSVPLKAISSFRLIKETEIDNSSYKEWKKKNLKTIEQAYKKAPYYEQVYPLVNNVFESEDKSISKLALNSIKAVCSYIGLKINCILSSEKFNNHELSAQARILDICTKEKAAQYINMKGGMTLYSKADFAEQNITLNFLEPELISYPQFKDEFIPWLSIIDVMMFNDPGQIKAMLDRYKLL